MKTMVPSAVTNLISVALKFALFSTTYASYLARSTGSIYLIAAVDLLFQVALYQAWSWSWSRVQFYITSFMYLLLNWDFSSDRFIVIE